MTISLQCLACKKEYSADDVRYRCDCGGLLDVRHNLDELRPTVSRQLFDGRSRTAPNPQFNPHTDSGVWRYRELILPVSLPEIVSRGEGNTALYRHQKLSDYTGVTDFYAKHEGENPTGSFKDRGMTVGTTQAKRIGARGSVCVNGQYLGIAGILCRQSRLARTGIYPQRKNCRRKIIASIGIRRKNHAN